MSPLVATPVTVPQSRILQRKKPNVLLGRHKPKSSIARITPTTRPREDEPYVPSGRHQLPKPVRVRQVYAKDSPGAWMNQQQPVVKASKVVKRTKTTQKPVNFYFGSRSGPDDKPKSEPALPPVAIAPLPQQTSQRPCFSQPDRRAYSLPSPTEADRNLLSIRQSTQRW